MSDIQKNIDELKKRIPSQDFTLIAVSKTKPNAAIEEAYAAGQRHFGENKVQEMAEKFEALPKDIHWHLIGHLQRNKVKYIAPFVALIHSVDSEKLLKEIDKEGKKNDRKIACLLQIHIAEEDTKFGFDAAEIQTLLKTATLANYPNVAIKGLMGMATFTDNQEQIAREFQQLKELFDQIKSDTDTLEKNNMDEFNTLSMGMSGDYPIAIEKGSNMIRVGTAIFGERNYH